jgi:predicted P-loop ATPase
MAKTQHAAVTAITHRKEWEGVIGYNEIQQRIESKKPTPWGSIGSWTDWDDTHLLQWYEVNGIDSTREMAFRAVEAVARDHSFNPLTEFLDECHHTWDRSFRLDGWLTKYAGVAETAYSNAVGRKWLIGAVARAFTPGCKFDTCLILQGKQGIGKSKLLKILGGEFFTDEISDFGSKDAALQMQSAWIIELAELDNLSKSEVSRIKAFMSRSTDRFRPPYSKYVIDSPRHCAFAGTVNPAEFLKDETGSRRFWPVVCGDIDLVSLSNDRENLLGEVVGAFKSGESWWLDEVSVIEDSIEQQLQHYDHDVWMPIIASYVRGKSNVSIDSVLEICLDKPPANWTHHDKMRVGKCLTMLGGKKRRKGLSRMKVYEFEFENENIQTQKENGNGVDVRAPHPTIQPLRFLV